MFDKFLAIKQKYMATFAQKHADIKGAWDEKDITSLGAMLHKLAGSSGSYGFDEINLLCYDAMDLLENYDNTNDAEIDGYIVKILELLSNSD